MPDNYENKCGSCKYIVWNDCVWGKFGCSQRPGRYYNCLETALDCKYYERSHLSNYEIEKLRLENLK